MNTNSNALNRRNQRRYNQNKLMTATKKLEQRRKAVKKHHFKSLKNTQELLASSEKLFTERRWDETTFLQIPTHTEKEEEVDPINGSNDHGMEAPLDGQEHHDYLELNHFAYRKRNIELKIIELNDTYKRLDVRTTIDTKGATEYEDELTGHSQLVVDSSLWTKNESNATYAALVQDTRMIAFPRQIGEHVTVLTAAHRQLEAPMTSKNEFILPNPLDGPRMLDNSRHSLSSSLAAKLTGSIARAGGRSVVRPNRYTAHITSKLTNVRHLTFLPPLHGSNELNSSTSHEERARIMRLQMRNAAARRIQRMWNHRTGILILLQKIRRRKQQQIEDAIRLKQEIADDKRQAQLMFARPSWASFNENQINDTQRYQHRQRRSVQPVLPVSDQSTLQQSTSPAPFHRSFKSYRNMRHIAHTITMHPGCIYNYNHTNLNID